MRNSSGDVFIQWPSAHGCLDVLETSTDAVTWMQVAAPRYGYGQVFSVSVPGARATPGAAGSGVFLPVYSFTLFRYSSGALVVRWTSDGLPCLMLGAHAHACAISRLLSAYF